VTPIYTIAPPESKEIPEKREAEKNFSKPLARYYGLR